MTQASSIPTQNEEPRAIRTPIDGIIVAVANRVGGSKAKEVERFLKFASVGTLGAMIDLGTSLILLKLIFDPRDTLQYLTAATISFVAAVMSNFFWNRYWTYPDSRSRSIQRQLIQFAIVSVSGWAGRTIWLRTTKSLFEKAVTRMAAYSSLQIDEVTTALIGGMIAILIGIFVVMIWNFFVNRYWTYNDID
ncbi:MAG: GtrA family protein [Anaerolineae bacterium]|nr:GtrA family protein [Anaerolineae bacterium]MDQ7037066.1 GtrA family protein [Anaerolineae bacterium]